MSNLVTIKKPQAAIDADLLNKEEAAEYVGMQKQAFALIASQIPAVRLGSFGKFYTKEALLAYLAKVQKISKKLPQPIEN